MTHYFLGVDLGGSKSHALIADETGQALGFGEAGAGNHEVVGEAGRIEALQTITTQALAEAGITKDQIAGAGFGIAGYDWPSGRASTLAAIHTLGLQTPLEAVNDAIIGLLAGAAEGWGIAVVAGTGCNCRGWDKNRREGRVTGHGILMGEDAGGGVLVFKAIHAISHEWASRGPATQLTPAFIKLAGAHDIEDLIEGLTMHRYEIDSDAAPIVFQIARAGDPVAKEIIAHAGKELGSLAVGVIRQLGFEALTFEVVLVGSLYKGGPLLIEPMRETVHALAPGARFVRLTAPPVVGGVLLGMEQAGREASQFRNRLIETTAELLKTRTLQQELMGGS